MRPIFAVALLSAGALASELDFMPKNNAQFYDEKIVNMAKRMAAGNIALLEEKAADSNALDPEHIPNWMKSFYDDFTPETGQIKRKHG
jgi:hypothetical protein